MKQSRKAAAQTVERALQLPDGTLTRGIRMEITDNRRVVAEGCKRVLKYEEDCVVLDTPCGAVRFCGQGLRVERFSSVGTAVDGRLLTVEFLG